MISEPLHAWRPGVAEACVARTASPLPACVSTAASARRGAVPFYPIVWAFLDVASIR